MPIQIHPVRLNPLLAFSRVLGLVTYAVSEVKKGGDGWPLILHIFPQSDCFSLLPLCNSLVNRALVLRLLFDLGT